MLLSSPLQPTDQRFTDDRRLWLLVHTFIMSLLGYHNGLFANCSVTTDVVNGCSESYGMLRTSSQPHTGYTWLPVARCIVQAIHTDVWRLPWHSTCLSDHPVQLLQWSLSLIINMWQHHCATSEDMLWWYFLQCRRTCHLELWFILCFVIT